MDNTLLIIIVAIIGVIAGGIVNAFADDLPKRRRVQFPPRYPDGEVRPATAWLGLTAFLLGQRQSSNGARLSWRYPLTEILTAVLMVMTLTSALEDGTGVVRTIFWLIFMPIFVLITVIDIEHKLILFAVINPSVILTFIYIVATQDGNYPNITDHLIGGIIGYGSFFLLYNGGFLFTYVMGRLRGQKIDEVAFGYGDVMLAGLSGLILGWQALVFALFVTIILGAIGALIYLIARRLLAGRYDAFTAIPYGPYIVIGTISMLLYSAEVVSILLPAR